MATTGWNKAWQEEKTKSFWNKPAESVLELIPMWQALDLHEVLDLGCGIGRHSLALAEAGFSVTALDSSATALSILASAKEKKGLGIALVKGDYRRSNFSPASFDVVISYNVLYHGSFLEFQEAIQQVYRYLRPGGFFFFTCPSREDAKYGHGEQVGPHTYKPDNSVHPGDVHYFADELDLERLLVGFDILISEKEEHYWKNEGTLEFSSYWQVLARKERSTAHSRFC